MKINLKKILPALALTVLIASTVAATNAGTISSFKTEGQWYGLPQNQPRQQLDPNTQPNPETDCDGSNHNCAVYVDGDTETPFPGGYYMPQ
ncbi:DUF6520 family protein [Pedobacter sp.]